MAGVTSGKVERALTKKGFVREPGDHRFYFLYDEKGKRTSIRTKVSHNQQEINDYLINCMKKQLHLTKSEFLDLVNCPLSRENYLAVLKNSGVLK